jgi:hypothetical protein
VDDESFDQDASRRAHRVVRVELDRGSGTAENRASSRARRREQRNHDDDDEKDNSQETCDAEAIDSRQVHPDQEAGRQTPSDDEAALGPVKRFKGFNS